MDENSEMKQNDLILFLNNILSYPRPSSNLYASFDRINTKDSTLLGKLLYIKRYNSLFDSKGISGTILKAEESSETLDDSKLIEYKKCFCEHVPFTTTYFGILRLKGTSVLVNTEKPFISVGIKTRETILFESVDRLCHIDISKSLEGTDFEFTRFKEHIHLFKEFCIEQSTKSLRLVFPLIEMISNISNIKELCLSFISVQISLFFGNISLDCYSLGDSLLFYNIKFRDKSILPSCKKTKEYIQLVLSENMIPPNRVSSYIFLFETLCFIESIEREKVFIKYNEIEDGYYRGEDSSRMSCNTLLNRTTVLSYILDDNGDIKFFNKIVDIHNKVLGFYRSNLHHYLEREDIVKMVNKIILQKKFQRDEILGVFMHLTGINNILRESKMGGTKSGEEDAINQKILDHEFLELIHKILRETRGYISSIKKEKSNALVLVKELVDLLIEIYHSLVYINNQIMIDIFSCGVFNIINSFNVENIKKIIKFKEFNQETIEKFKESRRLYLLEKEICSIMSLDVDPSYNNLEKKGLLRVSRIKDIKKEKHILEALERGKDFDEEMYKGYKIYIYEYLREKKTIKDFEKHFK